MYYIHQPWRENKTYRILVEKPEANMNTCVYRD